jgi:hypothetical protein
MSIHVLAVVAAGLLYDGAQAAVPPVAAEALAAPTPAFVVEDVQGVDLRDLAPPQRSQSRCREPASAKATSVRQGLEPTRVALGTTRCWWACYPGSGCQYVCQFYPQ